MPPLLTRRVVLLLIALVLIAALAMFLLTNGGAESPVSRADDLEYRLEMDRQQRLAAGKQKPGTRLAEFSSDGCSGGLSVGWEYLSRKIPSFSTRHGIRPPWESCCITHDRAYHAAGPRQASATESYQARKQADLALKTCVLKTGVKRAPALIAEYDISAEDVAFIYATIADLMYQAVRLGGLPCTGLPWRWGYGWPECDRTIL